MSHDWSKLSEWVHVLCREIESSHSQGSTFFTYVKKKKIWFPSFTPLPPDLHAASHSIEPPALRAQCSIVIHHPEGGKREIHVSLGRTPLLRLSANGDWWAGLRQGTWASAHSSSGSMLAPKHQLGTAIPSTVPTVWSTWQSGRGAYRKPWVKVLCQESDSC